MFKKSLFFFISLQFTVAILCAQQRNFYLIDSITLEKLNPADKAILDSIMPLYYKATHDTVQIKLLDYLAYNLMDETIWVKYNELLYDKSKNPLQNSNHLNEKERLFYNKYLNRSLVMKAVRYAQIGDLSKAIRLYNKCLETAEQIGDKEYTSLILNELGVIYQNQQDTSKALEYFKKSLKISKEVGNQQNASFYLDSIGEIYLQQNDFENALIYGQNALNVAQIGRAHV